MKKKNQILLGLSVLIVAVCMIIPYITIDQDVYDVKSGKVRLLCNIGGEIKVIAPYRLIDKKGPYWVFSNGQAQNCWKED